MGVVFAAGAGSLATEIAASRLLAPYFGNSTIVWANVIGLILASLSLGYWLGGRLADRRPTPRAPWSAVGAACLVALTLFARPLLDLSVEGLDRLGGGGDRVVLRRPRPVRSSRRPAGYGRAACGSAWRSQTS